MIEWIKNGFRTLFNWLLELWNSVVEFFKDVLLFVLDGFLSAVSAIVELIPVPQFIANGLGYYVENIDPSILYFLSQSGMADAAALLGAGLTFRLTRKIVTLGQW